MLKRGDIVRILRYPENDINAFGVVMKVITKDEIWVANMNMPFSGTISDTFSPKDLIKVD